MNIVIINHYAGCPKYGMEFRHYYLAKEWIKKGHNVTIIAASFSHLRSSQPEISDDFNAEIIDKIKYIWIKTPVYKSNYQRIFNIIVFIFKLFKYSSRIVSEFTPEIVIASSTYPLDIFPSKTIAKKSKAKLCYEVHDLWPLSPMIVGGYSKLHPYIQIMQFAENYAYKHSNSVVSLLNNAKSHMVKHGMEERKFVCIPNGYESISKELIPISHSDKLKELKKAGKIILGFAGGFTKSNALSTLLEVAELLKDDNRICFVMVGKGDLLNEYMSQVNDKNLQNVSILTSVNKNSIPNLISYFDICFEGGLNTTLHYFGTSANKMIDYLLAGKPIIYAVNEPVSIVEKAGCGIVVAAEDAVAIHKAIIKLLTYSKEELENLGIKGKEYVENNLQYKILAEKMISFIINE